jgi:hypothetical protein
VIQLDAEAQSAVQDVPADWGPDVVDDGRTLKWEGRVQLDGRMVSLEVGLRPRTDQERAEALEHLRRTSWTLTELARLGRGDLLRPFRKDRHTATGRPVSVPTLLPAAPKA